MLARTAIAWALSSAPAPTGPCDVAVHSESLDHAAFEAEARLRLPELRWRVADGEPDLACVGRIHAYVELRAEADDRWQLSLIWSDGRAWYRTIEAEPDQAARALASALANLFVAIEESSVTADAENVTLPGQLAESESESESATASEPSEPPPASEPSEVVTASRLLFELGPRLDGVAVIGLGPGPGLRGGAGGFGLDVRMPDGLAFGLALRTTTIRAADVSLTRVRVGLGLGVISRIGRFELPVMFAGHVEPWVVRRSGAVVGLEQPPLIGGDMRAAPGVAWTAGPIAMRLGLALGLAFTFEAAPGALSAAVSLDASSDPILRAGGVELSAGVELGVWIPVRARLKASSPPARHRRPAAPDPAAPTP